MTSKLGRDRGRRCCCASYGYVRTSWGVVPAYPISYKPLHMLGGNVSLSAPECVLYLDPFSLLISVSLNTTTPRRQQDRRQQQPRYQTCHGVFS